jgi:hypothetical protein
MPSTPQPPWDDYDASTQDDLEARLDGQVDAALDPADPSVDEDAARTLATRIADHEDAKREQGADDYHPRLHEEASRIRDADVGSWRPK